MNTLTQLLNKSGNRRFFITSLLIVCLSALIILKAPAEHVAAFVSLTSVAVTFWFTQHTDKPGGDS